MLIKEELFVYFIFYSLGGTVVAQTAVLHVSISIPRYMYDLLIFVAEFG